MEYGGRMMIEARIKGVNGIFSKETQFTHHRGNGILWRWNGAYLAKVVWRSREFSSGCLVDDIPSGSVKIATEYGHL